VDEADRLKMISLEQMQAIFDAGGVGLVLIGMPGIEKRMARYPQFYSRIGFVHEFRPLNVSEMRQLLTKGWTPLGVSLPALESEAVTSVIRVTGGNFRLFEQLLTQIERITDLIQIVK
jgi:DNA transposition AAA+ family ATPase